MTCDPNTVLCQLTSISASLAPVWDWASFVQTMTATLVGAAAALGGSWALARADHRRQYRVEARSTAVRLQEALIAAIVEIDENGRLEANSPVALALLGELSAFRAVLDKRDRPVAWFLSYAFAHTLDEQPDKQFDALEWCTDILASWLDGSTTGAECAANTPIELARDFGGEPDLRAWQQKTGYRVRGTD